MLGDDVDAATVAIEGRHESASQFNRDYSLLFGNHPSAMSCVRRYDAGMTKAKIAISLPKDQIARVRREVRAGRAPSVSGYIATVLAEQERCESLRELLRDLILQHGAPAAKDIKWAERALQQRRI
jgi:Arc/MetJ-type ribon-helix-helix transcriptional regulator